MLSDRSRFLTGLGVAPLLRQVAYVTTKVFHLVRAPLLVEEHVRLTVGHRLDGDRPGGRVVKLDPLRRRLVERVTRVVSAPGRAVVHDDSDEVVGGHFRNAVCDRPVDND